MNKVHYSPAAQNDLVEIGSYIREELANPVAAKNTLAKITRHIRQLERFPEIGAPLSSIVHLDSPYRFLVRGRYLAFYRLEKGNVFIDRILYGKKNYLAILFGDTTQENAQENEPS